jgi:hypothetical protein
MSMSAGVQNPARKGDCFIQTLGKTFFLALSSYQPTRAMGQDKRIGHHA